MNLWNYYLEYNSLKLRLFTINSLQIKTYQNVLQVEINESKKKYEIQEEMMNKMTGQNPNNFQ